MEIFNIGVLELLIVILIMFILLGPKEMIVTSQRVGRWIRNFVRSPMWREIMGYSQEIRELPKKIMDETGLDETLKEVQASTKEAVKEVNASIQEVNKEVKEAAEAARVREAEHLRLETNPAPEANQTILPPKAVDQPAVVETGLPAEELTSADSDAAADAQAQAETPAVLETALTSESVAVDRPVAVDQPVIEQSTADQAEAAAAQSQPNAALPEQEPIQEAQSQNEGAPAQVSVDLPPASGGAEEQASQAAAGGAVVTTAVDSAPAEAAPAPRKPRRKRVQSDEPGAVDANAAIEADPAASEAKPARRPRTRKAAPVDAEAQAAPTDGTSSGETPTDGTSTDAAPAKTRRPRKGARAYPVESAPESQSLSAEQTPADAAQPNPDAAESNGAKNGKTHHIHPETEDEEQKRNAEV